MPNVFKNVDPLGHDEQKGGLSCCHASVMCETIPPLLNRVKSIHKPDIIIVHSVFFCFLILIDISILSQIILYIVL